MGRGEKEAMNTQERQYRFAELMSAVHLLDPESENPQLPQGTLGLSDGKIKSAIMAQTLRESDEFQGKFINALANTALNHNHDEYGDPTPPNEDDLSALVIAIHIAWAVGAINPLLGLLGVMGRIQQYFDIELPDDLPLIFRPNGEANGFKKLDPLKILDDSISPVAVLKEALGGEIPDELWDSLDGLLSKKPKRKKKEK